GDECPVFPEARLLFPRGNVPEPNRAVRLSLVPATPRPGLEARIRAPRARDEELTIRRESKGGDPGPVALQLTHFLSRGDAPESNHPCLVSRGQNVATGTARGGSPIAEPLPFLPRFEVPDDHGNL